MMALKTTTSIALRLINLVMPGWRSYSADPFAGISTAINLDDEAEMESDPVKVVSDDSGSNAKDIDIEH